METTLAPVQPSLLRMPTDMLQTHTHTVQDHTAMTESAVRDASHARLAGIDRGGHAAETEDRPVQEIIARRVSRRARRRLLVAMLPLLLVTAVLVYLLVRYGL